MSSNNNPNTKSRHLLKDEEGASMAEYALLLGLITVAIATIVTVFGAKIGTVITNATNVLN